MRDKENMETGYPKNVVMAVFGMNPDNLLDDPDAEASKVAMLMGDRGALEIAMILANLTNREADVIRKRYIDMKTLKEIGSDFGVGNERIRQIEAKALRKMRREQCLKLFQRGAWQWMMDLVDQEADYKARRMVGQMVSNELQFRLERAERILDEREAEKLRIAMEDEEMRQAGGKAHLDSIKIEELDLTVRSYNCLKRGGVDTVGDITEKTYGELMKVRNLGRKSLNEIVQKIAEMGLKLKEEEVE